MIRHASPFALVALIPVAAFLPGCVGGDSERYPSLAIRDVERIDRELEPAPPLTPPGDPVASASELDGIVANARKYVDRFETAWPTALRLARQAGSAGPESEIRARALIALADLTSLHGRTAMTLGELDRLEAEAAVTLAPVEPIRTAQAQVAEWVRAQDDALTDVESAIR